jgi:hypothetical protein
MIAEKKGNVVVLSGSNKKEDRVHFDFFEKSIQRAG